MPDTSVAQELYSGSVPQRRVTISEQVTEIREDPKNKKSPSNDLPRSDNAPSTSTTTTTTASIADQISSPNRDSSPTREEGGHSVLARLLEEDELHTPTSPRGGEYRDNP
ncbi:hypothetical protein L873DRAFT_1813957 [Choiromyces venosus 120613-1]|uniref:Uncharacterized protein n=1 Tax=Choiromyces venosus 120613-1 TaxID=1336337 RepID=A0A3N4JDE4_9PEZI|nr:hypothetical protein L873DRAFT_1813957 [Choiromyces venosus 120613-1]